MRWLKIYGAFCLMLAMGSNGAEAGGLPQGVLQGQTPEGLSVELRLYKPSKIDLTRSPDSEEESVLFFVAGDDFEALQKLHEATEPYGETELTTLFWGQDRRFALREWPSPCGEDAGCLSLDPDVYLLTKIQLGARAMPVLTTGRTFVTSRLGPQPDDRPLTIQSFPESTFLLIWSGRWEEAPEGPLFFTVVLSSRGQDLRADQRRSVVQWIETQLNDLSRP